MIAAEHLAIVFSSADAVPVAVQNAKSAVSAPRETANRLPCIRSPFVVPAQARVESGIAPRPRAMMHAFPGDKATATNGSRFVSSERLNGDVPQHLCGRSTQGVVSAEVLVDDRFEVLQRLSTFQPATIDE